MQWLNNRPSRAGQDSKPVGNTLTAKRKKLERKCLRCRQEFFAETRLMFMCKTCRHVSGGLI